jgi:type VI secretion system secreted protein VgrG
MSDVVRSLKELLSARQNNRILRLSFPNDDAPPCEFVAESLHARESLSRDFEFTIEILSDNPRLELKDIQGKLLNVAKQPATTAA